MNYREIFKDKRMNDLQGAMLIDALEEWADDNDDLKVAIAIAAHEGHLCEYTAMHKIRHLKAPVYIDRDHKKVEAMSMCEYMSKMGITPEISHRLMQDAFEKIKIKAREYGDMMIIPSFNMWDAHYEIAKALSIHWYTICGDLDIAASIAAEHVSKK